MQGDIADIRERKAPALVPLAISAKLLLESDVLLQWRAVQQVCLVSQKCSELLHIIFCERHPRHFSDEVGKLCVRALAVEEFEQHPLLRRQAEITVSARHLCEHRRNALFDVLFMNNARMQAGIALADTFLRNFRKSSIESLKYVHC